MLEEGALLGLVVAHDGGEGGASVPLDHGKVDVGILSHFLQHEFALGVITGKAGCEQGQLGIQPGKVADGITHRAAGGILDTLGDVCQFVLLRPGFDGICNIHDHVTRAANAFFHG